MCQALEYFSVLRWSLKIAVDFEGVTPKEKKRMQGPDPLLSTLIMAFQIYLESLCLRRRTISRSRVMETYYGLVKTTMDGLLLYEACRKGILPRVVRRLSDRERFAIRPGSVFVWDESEAGMRRWTDGKTWSASRVSGSFLMYKERTKSQASSSEDEEEGGLHIRSTTSHWGGGAGAPGLMKQSLSITTIDGQKLHLISYLAKSPSANGGLRTPSSDPSLRNLFIPLNMYPEGSLSSNYQQSVVAPHPLLPQPQDGSSSVASSYQPSIVPRPILPQPQDDASSVASSNTSSTTHFDNLSGKHSAKSPLTQQREAPSNSNSPALAAFQPVPQSPPFSLPATSAIGISPRSLSITSLSSTNSSSWTSARRPSLDAIPLLHNHPMDGPMYHKHHPPMLPPLQQVQRSSEDTRLLERLKIDL